MRIFSILSSFLLVLGLLASSVAAKGLAEADAETSARPALTPRHPLDFGAVNLDGSSFDASVLKGTNVLLDFWAVWCVPCVDAFPKLDRLERDFRNQQFSVLGITVYSGSHADVESFLQDYDLDFRVVVADEELAERFGVIGYPTYFLISRQDTIHKQYVGVLPHLYDEIAADLAALEQSRPAQSGALGEARKEKP